MDHLVAVINDLAEAPSPGNSSLAATVLLVVTASHCRRFAWACILCKPSRLLCTVHRRCFTFSPPLSRFLFGLDNEGVEPNFLQTACHVSCLLAAFPAIHECSIPSPAGALLKECGLCWRHYLCQALHVPDG